MKLKYLNFYLNQLKKTNEDSQSNLQGDPLNGNCFLGLYVIEFLKQHGIRSFDNITFVNTVEGFKVNIYLKYLKFIIKIIISRKNHIFDTGTNF